MMSNLSEKIFKLLSFMLLGCAIIGRSSYFGQDYFVIQTIGLYLLSILLVLYWSLKVLRPYEVMFIVLAGCGFYFLFRNFYWPLPALNLFLCITILFSLISGNPKDLQIWKKSIICLSILQALISIPTLIPLFKNYFPVFNNEPVGTVGNSDFLATLFVCSLFYLSDFQLSKKVKFSLYGILCLGLISTMSKGTILLFIGIVAFKKWPKYVGLLALPAIVIFAFLFKQSLLGRLQLWLSALNIWKDHLWLGSGTGKFANSYFNVNKELMGLEWYKNLFGPWSSQVSDAHNLPLQWVSEWGMVGLLIAILFYIFIARSFKKSKDASREVIFLSAIKSLYTVLIPSLQALVMLTFALSDANKENSYFKKSKIAPIICLFFLMSCMGFILNFGTGQYYLKEGLKLSRAKYYEASIEKLSIAHIYLKQDYDVLLSLAYSYSKIGNCQMAVDNVYAAIEIQQDMDAFKRGGHILFECKKYEMALRLFSDVHLVFPEHRTTTMKMAWIYYFLRDFTTANKLANEVIDIRPRRKSFSDEKNLKEAQELISLYEMARF